ncbi:PREDICTED: limulus clotting factor C-like [Atta cephalotes]|uniref:Limulus clotting factor C n=1 Tax=Atta cephalotes TaxID=12957 RepID=A0A158NCS9_ATTCE|nr:PREDICTED: limulus clotting factor C-like [Atta cephalotes]
MRIFQWISALLTVIYVCIGSGYAQTYECGLDKFRCYNGDCIAGDLLCDGTPHCRDLSDETEAECTKPEILCHRYAFRCNYGACVNGDSICNGVQDCIDNSDETQPQCTKNTTNNQTERPTSRPISRPNRCTTNQITCDNGECIHKDNMCNGIQDCADGSDETSEKCRSIYCPPTAFRCSYGACINGDLRCNGVIECVDGSDEDSRCSETGWPSPLPTVRPTTETTRWPISSPTPTRGTNACRAPPQPQNGHWKLHRSQCSSGQECNVPEGMELGLGSHLVYSCNSGYKLRGPTDVSCSFEGKWLNIPVCTEIRCKALTTASIEARCTYDDEWISCESPVPPRTKAVLECQNSYRPETNLLTGQRKNVRCNANGQWEPEPMRCIPVCGTLPPDVTPTIVGGVRPNITEFPWHATMYRNIGKSKKFFCGASIIQDNLLITAAHCVYDEINRQPINARSIYILTGNIYRDYDYAHNPTLVKKNQVKHIYIVRNYLGLIGNYLWDIAILELVRPFILSTWLVPICIDTLSDRSVLEAGSYGKVAGFGRTAFGESSAILQALTVPVIPLSQCRSASQNANTEQFITNDKFCAGYTNGSSVCDGDSGGGLVFKTNRLWYLRGIVSVSLGTIQKDGTAYCDNNLYSLYTEISRHISWIQDVITKIEQNQTHILCSNESQTRCS